MSEPKAESEATLPAAIAQRTKRDERFAHLVADPIALAEAMAVGEPVTSVCGKTWVPSRDPNAYALCRVCTDVIRKGWAA